MLRPHSQQSHDVPIVCTASTSLCPFCMTLQRQVGMYASSAPHKCWLTDDTFIGATALQMFWQSAAQRLHASRHRLLVVPHPNLTCPACTLLTCVAPLCRALQEARVPAGPRLLLLHHLDQYKYMLKPGMPVPGAPPLPPAAPAPPQKGAPPRASGML